MTDPFADAADYFGDDAAPTPPLSPRPALFPAPSAEEVAEAKARKEAAAAPPESSPPPPPARKRPKQRGLRVGAWSDEEVAYAERVSDLYRQGKLPNCPDGTTFRRPPLTRGARLTSRCPRRQHPSTSSPLARKTRRIPPPLDIV